MTTPWVAEVVLDNLKVSLADFSSGAARSYKSRELLLSFNELLDK
jgi:hypothetical protein